MSNPEAKPQLGFDYDDEISTDKTQSQNPPPIEVKPVEPPKQTKIVRDPSDGSTYEVPIDR